MNYSERAALVAELVDRLHAHGSWAGETHLQKTLFFLQDGLNVPLEYDFILYKHGPFSFAFRDELAQMRVDGLLDLKANPIPYGPSFVSTETSKAWRTIMTAVVEEFEPQVEYVADKLGPKGVVALEKLATSLYFTIQSPNAPTESRAEAIHEVKPHISMFEAVRAVNEVDALKAQAPG